MVTFPVDDVTPASAPLPTRPLRERYPDTLVLGGDPTLPVLDPNGVHPLLAAVGQAFAQHRPLVLTPDAVWLTIAQGVAAHVRLHAEELRPRLVGHQGRKRLTVSVDGPMPTDPDSWRDAVERYEKMVAAETGYADLFACDFSTSTDVERVAGRIVLMDAYSPYFAYWMVCVCGIPTVTLTGTVEDWRKIRARVDRIAELGLQTWCRSLVPITEHLVRAAEGDADRAFWQRIYNPVDAYGGEVITGWAARLYPYLRGGGAIDVPNSLLELPIDEPRNVTSDGMFYDGPGIGSDSVPATLSRVQINVVDGVAGANRAVALHAGLVGIAQDGLALRPVAGWHLTTATVEIDDVVDRIVRDHQTTPPAGPLDDGPAELIGLYQRIGSATLFGGAWRILPVTGHRRVDRPDGTSIAAVVDLADGRSVCAALDFRQQATRWVVCRVESDAVLEHPEDIPVYGDSLAFLLDAALDSDGDIAHLETGRLNQVDM